MNSLYMRLAGQNIKKHRRSYVPYMLTGILTAAVYYILHSLANNPDVGETASVMLNLGVSIVMVFSVIFLFYTNRFLMKQRKKEFGLYNVLGMNKGHIARVIGLETLIAALVILAGGIGAGMLLDRLIYLLVANLIGFEVSLGFYISTGSIVQTLLLFGVISFLIYLSNIFRVWRAKPIELLQGGNIGEREPKTKVFMAILGAACLGSGYALSILSSQEAGLAILSFFVAVLLVIFGTYLLFTAGSIAVLKLLRRNKNYYYKTQHFISVSGMLYRMKQNAVGLANICILSTMVLVTISSTCSLWFGSNQMIRNRYPSDIIGYVRGDEVTEAFDEFFRAEMDKHPEFTWQSYVYTAFTTEYDPNGSFRIEADTRSALNSLTGLSNYLETAVMPLSQYNAITGQSVELGENEAMAFLKDGSAFGGSAIELYGKTYTPVEPPETFPIRGRVSANILDAAVLVVPDYEAMLSRIGEEENLSASYTVYCADLGDLSDDEQSAYFAEMFNKGWDDLVFEEEISGGWSLECRVDNERDAYAMYGTFLFMGISLGLLFTMAAVLIIYYKQISEGLDDKARFSIMRKVGLSQSEAKRSIHSQILTVFFLPLVTAGIHIIFAFPIINCILRAMMLQQVTTFIVCTAVTFVVFAVFYAIVYALTAKVYYRIVSEN